MGGGRAEWVKKLASMPAPQMPIEKLRRWGEELKKGIGGHFEKHRWIPSRLSAIKRAKIRRQVLLAGGEWPYEKPRKEMRNIVKGTKAQRTAADRQKSIAEVMLKMPQMIADARKRARDRRHAAAKNK